MAKGFLPPYHLVPCHFAIHVINKVLAGEYQILKGVKKL